MFGYILTLFVSVACVALVASQYSVVPKPGPDSRRSPLNLVYDWTQFEPLYPSEAVRNAAIATREYVPGSMVPVDVDVFYPNDDTRSRRIFVTFPRLRVGRAFTLGTVVPPAEGNPSPRSPLVAAYPNLDWHRNPANCSGLTSVFRVSIDECNRLWVLDSGRVFTNQLCPPEILSFDLSTNKLLSRHAFESPLYRQTSLFVTPVIDIRGSCDSLFIYIADVQGFGMLVYDHASNKTWRVDNKLFYPFPSYGTHRLAGQQFELMDGVVGMALDPWARGVERQLFFHSLASVTENHVPTSVIRNSSLFNTTTQGVPGSFQVYPNTRSSQSAATVIDSNGVMFFGLNEKLSLACWNTALDYGADNISVVAEDPINIQFISGIKITKNNYGDEELWIMTNSFQKYMTNTLTNTTTNFRVLQGDPDQLIRGTVCDSRYRRGFGWRDRRDLNKGQRDSWCK